MISYYEPHIVTAQDYYPFGMLSRVSLPNSGKTYKFGFQGEMNDNEAKGLGNQIAFNFRIHDPRVGRFLSVDPIVDQYPEASPYAFAHNKVNFGNEKEGLEIIEGYFKYNQWALNKLGLGDTWVNDLNNSLYNRFSIEGRINQLTTSVKTEVQQIKNNPGQYLLNKVVEADPIAGTIKRSIESGETIKRVGSGIAHGNTDAIAEGIDMAAQFYAGYKTGIKPVKKGPALPSSKANPVSSELLDWEELRHRAIMTDEPLSIATSTNGHEFRAVVQNIEVAYGNNVLGLLSDLTKQARSAGATSLEIQGIEITNSQFKKMFSNANGKKLLGYDVEYTQGKSGYGEVTLKKELPKE